MNEEMLFHLALEKAPRERDSFLEEACAGEPELRRRVEILLKGHAKQDSFLETPVSRPDDATQPSDSAVDEPADPDMTQAEPARAKPEGLEFLAPSTKLGFLG